MSMFSLAIVHTLIGAVLGLRFKVMVLVPMFAISLIAIAGVNAALGAGLWMAVIEMVIAVTSAQVGYLGGAAIRLFLAAPRGAAAEHTSPNTVSRPIS
jgi:hypothetical protein